MDVIFCSGEDLGASVGLSDDDKVKKSVLGVIISTVIPRIHRGHLSGMSHKAGMLGLQLV